MNIYLISQSVNNDYDTFDSAVVAAETEKDAREIHPSSFYKRFQGGWGFTYACGDVKFEGTTTGDWCSSEDVAVKLIGVGTHKDSGVILSSFNAG